MAPFSITDAATAGFSVVRRNPRALIVWAGVALAAIIVMIVVFITLGGSHFMAAAEAFRGGALEDPAAAQQILRPLVPAYVASLIVGLAAYAVLTPAVYRSVLNCDEASPGQLRFGMAEVRQFAILSGVLVIVAGIDLAFGYLARAISGGTGPVAFGLSLASFLLIVYLLVRLSLAGPDTLARERLSFAGSWKLSKGAYAPLLATFALALLFQAMITVGSVLIMTVVVGLTALAEGMGGAGVVIIAVIMVAYLVVICLIYALSVAVVAAPAAYAYRALTSTAPGAAAPG